MKKIFIDGSAGTTGLRIFERLSERKDIELVTLSDELRKDSAARKLDMLEDEEDFQKVGDMLKKRMENVLPQEPIKSVVLYHLFVHGFYVNAQPYPLKQHQSLSVLLPLA